MPSNNKWFGTTLFVVLVVLAILGTFLIKWPDFNNKAALHNVVIQNSVLDASMTVAYDKPPIYRESYHMHNDNGVSTAEYRIQGYSGKVVTITLPPNKTYSVSFFFQEIVQDGIWQLMNKNDAGNTDVHYTLHVFQVAGKEHGSRTVTFTDPHYWAVAAGRQYQIQMTKNGPTPDLTKLESTSLADPRYEQIVKAFRAFGTPAFRARVAQAQALVRRSH